MWGPAGAIVNHVTAQSQDQERLLGEAKRELEAFKKAYYKAEGEMHDREERFEQEKQALNDEIHQLKVRFFPPAQYEAFCGRHKLIDVRQNGDANRSVSHSGHRGS